MRTLWGKRGSAVTLPCDIKTPQKESFTLEWRKDDKLIVSAYGRESGHTTPILKGRLSRASGLGLTIHAVSREDAGVFQCSVTLFSKQPTLPHHGSAVRLIVNVVPQIVFPSGSVVEYVKAGENITIECKVDGVPPPEVTWMNNNRIVSTSSNLSITNLTKTDTGVYTCLAINIEGSDSNTVELRMMEKTSFDFSPTNKTVVEGSNVFWHCHAHSQPIQILYNWTFEGRPIKQTPTGLRAEVQGGDISLRDVQKTDSGWYSCDATNARGDISQSSAYLDVQYVPRSRPSHRQMITIEMSKNGQIACDVDANPPASNFEWSKNGYPITHANQAILQISDAKDSDSGIYRCRPSNSVGEGETLETHVVIADPPTFISRPPPEIRVRLGTSIDIPCEGFGDPQPIVYWVRNQTRISSSTLSFSSIVHSDHGVYECLISNSVSTVSSKMRIIVEKAPPQPAEIKRVICKDEDKLIVDWEPGFDGSYSQTFTVHYRSDLDSTPHLVTTANTTTILSGLRSFEVYDIYVESRNRKGSTTSQHVHKAVCSTLPSPSNVNVDGSTVKWAPVEEAKSYLVETRSSKKGQFQRKSEVIHPYYHLVEKDEQSFMELRVRSLRPPYSPSRPSSSVEIGYQSHENSELSVMWALSGGLLFFVLFILLWILSRRRKAYNHFRKCKRSFSKSENVHPATGSQPQTETFYEPSLNLMDNGEYGDWCGEGDNSVRIPYPESLLEVEYSGNESTAVDDMLRQKYIYEVEDVPTQLITDLRIERLRREFKQSQL